MVSGLVVELMMAEGLLWMGETEVSSVPLCGSDV